MKIFLTGGTGFIGAHFINVAHAAGHEVISLRRSVCSRPPIQLDREPLWLDKELKYLEVLDLGTCDAIVHLASAGVSPQKATDSELIDINVSGIIHLMRCACEASIPRIAVAGTFAEYGRSADDHEVIPPMAPLLPTYPYAASKAAGFVVAHALAIELSLEFVYLRIFSAFGRGQHQANFWPSLEKAAREGGDFCMTKGEQIRDFCAVELVAEKFLEAVISPHVNPGVPLVQNVGSGSPTTLRKFAEKWWEKFGATGSIKFGALEYRPNEVMKFVPEL